MKSTNNSTTTFSSIRNNLFPIEQIKNSNIIKVSFLLIIFLGIQFFFHGCQPTVSPEESKTKLFANFYLRLVQDEPIVKGEVSFFEGDSLPASRPRTFKQVLLNNQLMAAKELRMKGTSYRGTLNGSADSLYTFSFINGNDQQQSHQVVVDRIDAFLVKEPWRKSTGMTIVWKGNPLEKQDQMIVLFTDAYNKSTFVELDGPTDWSEITLTATQIKEIPLGPVKLHLVRKSNRTKDFESNRFSSRVEFFTSPIQIQVKE